jgi:hypothetical protein
MGVGPNTGGGGGGGRSSNKSNSSSSAITQQHNVQNHQHKFTPLKKTMDPMMVQQPGSAAVRDGTAKMVWTYVGALVALVLLIIVAVLVVEAVNRKKKSGCSTPQNTTPQNTTPRNTTSRLSVKHTQTQPTLTQPMPPLAPLTWSDAEGAYMIQLFLGVGPVQLVLDTGSCQVSAKVDGCQWTQCTGEEGGVKEQAECTTQACPCEQGDCTLHYYKPSSQGYPLQAGSHGYSSTMKYGSQEDHVSHVMDKVVIPKLLLTCPQLLLQKDARGPSRLLHAAQPQEHAVSADMVVHQVHRIKGTSTSNMFGLARPDTQHRSSKRTPVVLDKLFDAMKTHATDAKVWSLLLFVNHGWWALGSIPCFQHKQVMPLIDPPAFRAFVTKFYIVPLTRMEVGPTLDMMRRVPRAPSYIVIDTGTTYTYGSTRLGTALDKLGYDERSWYVRFTLGTAVLLFHPHQLKDPDFPDSSVIQCTPGRTLDGFDSIFSGTHVLLWGAYMMRNMYWEFNLSNNTVGVEVMA